MPPADLAGCNYNAPVGNEDVKFEQTVYRDEFLNRMRLVFGHPDFLTDASWGIVAESDPADSTALTGPLRCTASTTDLTVSVTAGIAVTKSGHWVYLETAQSTVGMSSSEVGSQNVITLKFSTKDPDERAPNEFGIPLFKRRLAQDDDAKVVVYSTTEWAALTSEQQDDHVPLALATVTSTGSSSILSLIQTNTSYTWLRPWFSPVDIRHRKSVGSGTVSETNPHGISFNELTVGNFTLPMLTSHWGKIVSKDVSFANVPGQACEVTVPSGLIQTDDGSGTATGVPNTKYIDLDFYPIQVGAVSTDGTPDQMWAFEQKNRTQRIFQPADVALVPASTDVVVRAIKVETLEPNGLLTASTSKTRFTAGSLDANDAVVASGKVYVSTMSVNLVNDFAADAGPQTLSYRMYFAAGEVVRNPQVLICATKISEITGSGIIPSITPFDQGVILVGLDQAAAGSSLDVQVKITGTDPDGAAVQETLTFDSTWSQGTVGLINDGSFKLGTTVFATVDAVTVPVHLNEGPNALLQVWLAMDPATTDLAYAVPIADITWDGSQMTSVGDIRPINYDLQFPQDSDGNGLAATIQHVLLAEPAGTRSLRYLETFTRPRYHQLIDGGWQTFEAAGSIGVQDRTSATLDSYYYSRALALSLDAKRLGVFCYPPLFAEWHRQHTMTLSYRTQNNLGVWSVLAHITSTTTKNFTITLPANTRAVQLRVVGTDLRGMAIIEYTS
jgi:hypothetical protein